MKKWIIMLAFVFTLSLIGCNAANSDSDDIETNTVTVYFSVYGGSVVDLITLEKGGTISPPIEPLRTGYTFDGWFYDSDYLIPFNFDAPINSNIQVHAKWTENNNTSTVTITFNSNGGSPITSINGNTGDTFTLPLAPTKTSHTFDGWFTNAAFTTPFTNTVFPDANLTLHAKWVENTNNTETTTITFNTNGGDTIAPLTANIGDSFTLPTPIKSGHTFDEWFTNSALTTPFASSVMPNANITLYAKWIENVTSPDTATISFNTNDGSYIAPLTSDVGDLITLPIPTKTNYTFDGWFTNTALTIPFTDSTMPPSDITLYAKWTENTNTPDTITINFMTNGGSLVDSITLDTGETYWPPAQPTRVDYDFAGWYLNANFTIPLVSTTTFTEDTTLYAKWTETVTIVSEIISMLETNTWGFTCSNNICTLEEGPNILYTFNFSTLTFTKENSTSSDEQTKHEIVTVNENWSVSYSIDIVYLETQTASMTVTGNGQTGTYNVTSFSSNYLSQSSLYDEAIQFIDGPYGVGLVGLIKVMLIESNTTMDDLK
ncbi:MAG: InlB B-repeat-containing protein [Bacillota bacterium]